MLHSMVLPIYTQIEGERHVRAKMQSVYDKLMTRLDNVESLLGSSSNNKPQMIVEIENEIASIRSNHAEVETELRNDLRLTNVSFERLKNIVAD